MRPSRVSIRLGGALAMTLAAGFALGQGANAQNASGNVVYCYNEALDLVQNTAPSQCNGRIIDAKEAEEVKRRRLDRMRGAVSRPAPEVAPGKKLTGTGSGFFVAADGRLVTNNHVIDNCAAVSVLPPDLERKEARVLAVDTANDFALLAVDLVPTAVATFRVPAERGAGRKVVLIGYPKNEAIARIQPFLTPGETKAPRSRFPSFLGLQFHADVRPGNSGGPLLDESGMVLGVVTAKINTVNIAKQTGQVIREIGYATDNDILLQFLKAQGVPYATATEGPALKDAGLLTVAKGFATRVECWK